MPATSSIRTRWWWAAAAATLLAWPAGARADAVELRSTARVQRVPVLLGDIADLRGPAATSLGQTVIATELPPDAWQTIDPASVRAALDALPPGSVDWTALTVSGGAVRVRLVTPNASPASPASDLPRRATPPESPQRPLEPEAGTVGALVPGRLAEFFAVPASSLRVELSAADAEILGTPTAGRSVEIRPGAVSDRVPLSIIVYERDRIVARGSARAGVRVLRETPVARRDIRRGEPVTPDAFELTPQWLDPAQRPAGPAELDGALARGRIRAGAVIRPADLEAPEVVRKGDLVWVHTVAGGMSLKRLSRAKADGRVGEIVVFEPAEPAASPARRGGSRPPAPREYRARVSGPGAAVIEFSESGPPTPEPDRASPQEDRP